MKRALIAGSVLLAGCMSHERSATSGDASSRSGDAPREQTAVVQPSDFAPEQVRTLQRALSDRGFAVDLTGRFDDRTQTALMDFQRARGLPSTGNLNQPTMEALGIDPREVMPVRGENAAGQGAAAGAAASGGDSTRPGDAQAPPAEPSTAPSKPGW